MPLTVKEKEHWKERIEKEIDKAIEKAYRDEGNGLQEKIRQQAKTRAMKHYGLEDYMRRYSSRKAQIQELQSQQFRASEAAAKPLEETDAEKRDQADAVAGEAARKLLKNDSGEAVPVTGNEQPA